MKDRTWTLALAGAAAALLLAPAAEADVTLRYASDYPGQSLVIEEDDEGRVRAEEGNGQMLIVRDGTMYVVTPETSDGRIVARLDDFIAVGNELRTLLVEAEALSEAEDVDYAIRELGAERVGAFEGTGYAIEPRGAGVSQEIVISTDPALAEAGPLAVSIFEGLDQVARAFLFFPAEFLRLVGETYDRGAPIRVDNLSLERVSSDPVPPERFELPAPVLDREALRARMLQR